MGPCVNGNVYPVTEICNYTTDNKSFNDNLSQITFWGIIQTILLIITVLISVYKPWKSKGKWYILIDLTPLQYKLLRKWMIYWNRDFSDYCRNACSVKFLYPNWQKLYAKLEELCKDVRVLRNADRVLPEDDNLLDNQDLCLLFKVSIKTLQRYRAIGALPYFTISGKVYYKASDVREFIKERFSVTTLRKFEKEYCTKKKKWIWKARTVNVLHLFRLSLLMAYLTYRLLSLAFRLARSTALHVPVLLPTFGCGIQNPSRNRSNFG